MSKESRRTIGMRHEGRGALLRLKIETLESRRLLAGINVSVYVDQNLSQGFDSSTDAPAANRVVYIDLNKSGEYDSGEPMAVTDAQGRVLFDGLDAGEYAVGLITNESTQRQIDPSIIAPQRGSELASTSRWLVHDPSMEQVWGISVDGQIDAVRSANPSATPVSSRLPGQPQAVLQVSDGLTWIAYAKPNGGSAIATLDMVSGRVDLVTLSGLAADASIEHLAQTNSAIYASMRTTSGTHLVQLIGHADPGAGTSPKIDAVDTGLPGGLLGASAQASEVVVVTEVSGGSRLSVLDADLNTLETLELEEAVVEVAIEGVSHRIAVATELGVLVFDQAADGLSAVAILAEAAAPLAFTSATQRLLTGNRTQSEELIVWNSQTWALLGRSSLRSQNGGVGKVQSIATSAEGDQAWVASGLKVLAVDLAVATTKVVRLATDNVSVQLGVQEVGVNTPPRRTSTEPVWALEDTPQTLQLRDSIADVDGDVLWFGLATPPTHGSLELSTDGLLTYTPSPDYSGLDTTSIRVFDGQASTLVQLQWVIEAVNDAPLSLTVEVDPFGEDTAIGSELGFVSIVDADRDAEYRVTTSDARFRVENGRLYLNGPVNFEAGGSIVVEVLAVDTSDETIQIDTTSTLTILDVNEPPTAIEIDSVSVEENMPGAVVGHLHVVDEDGGSDYELSVSDPRFVIDGLLLRLADGQSLDFETERSVALAVTARDRTSGGFDMSSEVNLTVVNRDDAPTDITLTRYALEEFSPGAVVGELRTLDQDGEVYRYSVDDDRFEIVGSTLKLQEGTTLNSSTEPLISLTVTGTASSGHSLTVTVPIQVVAPLPPYQNPRNPVDVNNDGELTPLDVLLVINDLNRNGTHPVPPSVGGGEPPQAFPDVNGDDIISPLDVLLIINELNEQDARIGGEGEGASLAANSGLNSAQSFASVDDADGERRRKVNSEIDAELEMLLDQLSNEQSQS